MTEAEFLKFLNEAINEATAKSIKAKKGRDRSQEQYYIGAADAFQKIWSMVLDEQIKIGEKS